MSPPTRLRTLARLLLIAAGIAVLAWLMSRGFKHTENRFADFYDFYWAADAARRGTDMYASGDGGYVYPPLLAVILIPLSLLDPHLAMRVWIVASAVLLVWCLWRSVKLATDSVGVKDSSLGTGALSAIVLLILFDSFRGEFEWANCNIPMMAAIVLGMAWLRTKPVLGGAALALACAIKYIPLAFLPYLLVRRQWKAAGGMTAGLLACALLPSLWLGWNRNLEYLSIAMRGMGVMSGASSAPTASSGSKPAASVIPIDAEYSLSITSGIARVLGSDRSFASLALWTGGALVIAVGVAWAMYRARGIGFFTLRDRTSKDARRGASLSSMPSLWLSECCAVLAAALAFAPQTQERHFNLLVPLIAGLVVVSGRVPGKSRIFSIAALLVFAAGVTPMLNLPGTREFVDGVWKWSGAPGWLTLAVAYVFVWTSMSKPVTSDHAR